jgi:signal transduction histidine kinase
VAVDERATLLVVEDDPGVARLQQVRLERAGYRVVAAATAAAALDHVRRGGIDLLLLDQNLPGGASGLQLYQQMKAAGHDLPAILVTSLTGDSIVLQALRAGVFDFVPKTPDYLDYLLPAVERILTKRRTERQLAESRERLIGEQAARREAEAAHQRMVAVANENARLYQNLRHADRLKDEFLAMLAHELRNPLAPIRNALHLIRLAGQEADAGDNWAVIERQVNLLVRLVDDLLDVSRISQGKIRLQKTPVDLGEVVARAVESSRPLIDARRHQLTVTMPPASVVVDGDAVRLVQVLANLLNNAAKYTPEGGRIELAAEAAAAPSASGPGTALLRVRDTGVGIPADMLPHLFDLFTQSERTLDRADGGLGVGLTLVRRLVELHGGKVQALSRGPGQGSEFVVRLPLARAAVVPARPAASNPEDAGPRRVLVVDDNEDSAATLGQLLRLLGNEVQLAHDGEAALDAAQTFEPEVILLDIGLPGMDGFEVGRRLRADHRFDATVLVALTGYGSPEDRRHSQQAGFNAHLVKPVDLEALRQVLAHPEVLRPDGRA